jgi:phosphotransferase system IIB component
VNLAEELLAAVGGAQNVVALTRCWARLRFELHDPSVADEDVFGPCPAW